MRQAFFFHLCQHKVDEVGLGTALLLSHTQGQLTWTTPNRISSTLLFSPGTGPTLSNVAIGVRQIHFSLLLQTVKGRANSVLTYPVSVVTGATDINMDRGCGRVMDTDMDFESP